MLQKDFLDNQSKKNLDFLSEKDYIKLRTDIEYILNQLNALYKKLDI